MSRRRLTPSDTIDRLIVVLFHFVREECNRSSTTSTSRDGFTFEDRVCKEAYDYIRKYPVTVLPPRSTLNYPTLSGLKHQFDVTVMEENTFYVIECKKRGVALIDQVFSFNCKTLDYALKDTFSQSFHIKGIFLCTAKINPNIRKYALAYGILPIDSYLPPIQVMIDQIQEGDELRKGLDQLRRLLMLPLPDILKSKMGGHELLHRLLLCHQSWKNRGFG